MIKIFINTSSLTEDISNLDINSMLIDFAKRIQGLRLIVGDFNLAGFVEDVHSITLKNTILKEHIKSCTDYEAKGLLLSKVFSFEQIDNIEHVENILGDPILLSFMTHEKYNECNITIDEIAFKNYPCYYTGSLFSRVMRGEILYDSKKSGHTDPITGYGGADYLQSTFAYLLYNENYHSEFTEFTRTSGLGQRSLIFSTADFIARINGFSKNQALIKKNKGYVIYSKKHANYYLSIDFLHGCFEVLDINGKHICEINFKNELTAERDTSGSHDIYI
ncbi:hypothetical protein D3C78_542920 [compost metagenome]